MREILQRIQHYKREPLSPRHFSEWVDHPGTKALLLDLADSIIDQIDDPPPDSVEQTALHYHRVQGMRMAVEAILEFMEQNPNEEDEDDQTDG